MSLWSYHCWFLVGLFVLNRVKMDGGQLRTLLEFYNASSLLVVEIIQKTAHMPREPKLTDKWKIPDA